MSPFVCLACGSMDGFHILSLGDMPLANALLTQPDLVRPEPTFPLDLMLCRSCCLVQLADTVPPDRLFKQYPYFSSQSETIVQQARELVQRLVTELDLSEDDLALEVASNDGYLLRHYADSGVSVLGIDPAENVASAARAIGVPTECAFFDSALALELREKGRQARVLHANNVLAHVPDINDFVTGIATALRDDGVAVIETPYVRDLIERVEFDTIYHEHVFYYSLTSLHHLFNRNDLSIVDVKRIPVHGGSLRIVATHRGAAEVRASVSSILEEERELGLCRDEYYGAFSREVAAIRKKLPRFIDALRAEGSRIAAYGAAAKGAVLLNATSIGVERIEFVVDRSPHKQGCYMPGVHIPICETNRLLQDMPDHVLLLAWNFVEEITRQQQGYLRAGGHFVVPIPEPYVLEPSDAHIDHRSP